MNTTGHQTPGRATPTRGKQVFSLAEANRALVLIRRIVTDVVFEYSRMLELQEQLETAEESGTEAQSEQARTDLIRSAGRLRTCLTELDDVGVELRDWATGVVDLPSFAGGREICLCWQYGQERIEYWHEVDAGFDRRQPIANLPDTGAYLRSAANEIAAEN